MKTLSKALLALITTSVIATTGNAALFQIANGTGLTGQPYVGVKVGQYNVSPARGDFNNDNPTAYGIIGGYQYDANWGVEGEYVGSNKADFNDKRTTTIPATTTNIGTTVPQTEVKLKGTLKGETFGLYGTYKYDFPNTAVYVKGKLGIAQNKLKMATSSFTLPDNATPSNTIKFPSSSHTAKESGIAGGVGVGYHLSPAFAVEAEYSVLPKIEDSESDLITVGAKMKF